MFYCAVVHLRLTYSKARGTKEHMLSSQVPPHPMQSKNKIYIYINYFNTYTDTNLFDVKPMQ